MFLDINMPILDGLSFLKSLVVKPMVIMTTAYESHALESFELQAIDYLVKPIPFPRFLSAVQRVIALSNGWQNPEKKLDAHKSIFVKVDKKKLQKIDLNSIVLIESLKDYIRIKTDQGKYIFSIFRTRSQVASMKSRSWEIMSRVPLYACSQDCSHKVASRSR